MSIKKHCLGAALLSLVVAGSVYAQGFSSPQQSGITAAGNTQRFAVSGAYYNGLTYVAYTASNGSVYIASDPNNNLTFSNQVQATSPQGPITAAGNPSLAYDASSGRLYMAYIVNGGVQLAYTTNPYQGFTNAVGIASGADASPSITAQGGTVYLGYHKNSGQVTIVCSVAGGTAPTCSQPSGGGSTYGPGVAIFGGQLYTFFQSNNSAHSLYYFRSNLNPDGTINNFGLMTDISNDQTSGQPSAYAVSSDVLLVGFRSNDSSANFLGRAYHLSGGGNYWSSSVNNNIGMNGAPSLLGVPGRAVVNLFVGKNSPYYINSTYSSGGF